MSGSSGSPLVLSRDAKIFLRGSLKKGLHAASGLRARVLGVEVVDAGKVVWMLGSGRTGSTWLSSMMDDLSGQTVWREPRVGSLFGNFYYDHPDALKADHFIMAEKYRDVWMKAVRDAVLGGAAARFPTLRLQNHFLVIKEPNGSVGAPILLEALPESRMIFLIRDPRDVVASSLDAHKKDSWLYENKELSSKVAPAERNPNVYVKRRAASYARQVGNTKKAYDAHEGRKAVVRYEDLREDTLSTMLSMYERLEIDVDRAELVGVIEKHSWERIPESEKGEGKFYRKGESGGWREDLTVEQARIVERATSPLIGEFYPS